MKTKKLVVSFLLISGIAVGAVAYAGASKNDEITVEIKDSKKFVKTSYGCKKCSCSGYWGYYHSNGTYEGACQHTDQWGHRCGHSPEQHGLRSW